MLALPVATVLHFLLPLVENTVVCFFISKSGTHFYYFAEDFNQSLFSLHYIATTLTSDSDLICFVYFALQNLSTRALYAYMLRILYKSLVDPFSNVHKQDRDARNILVPPLFKGISFTNHLCDLESWLDEHQHVFCTRSILFDFTLPHARSVSSETKVEVCRFDLNAFMLLKTVELDLPMQLDT